MKGNPDASRLEMSASGLANILLPASPSTAIRSRHRIAAGSVGTPVEPFNQRRECAAAEGS